LQHELDLRRRTRTSNAGVAVSSAAGSLPQEISRPGTATTHVPAAFAEQVDARKVITIVSGLPRSGTSMMMQLLVAAGREALTDAMRAPDEDNPLGYFEFEKALHLAKDISWLPQARGKVVKIVAQLLPLLPADEHYNIIFMERNLAEVIASQDAMLLRRSRVGAQLDAGRLQEIYLTQLRQVCNQIDGRSEMRTLFVDYGSLLANTPKAIARVAQFLGEPFDQQAGADVVRPEMQRQKA
jgi:hypothetical protein